MIIGIPSTAGLAKISVSKKPIAPKIIDKPCRDRRAQFRNLQRPTPINVYATYARNHRTSKEYPTTGLRETWLIGGISVLTEARPTADTMITKHMLPTQPIHKKAKARSVIPIGLSRLGIIE
jgi:hypothetical protein